MRAFRRLALATAICLAAACSNDSTAPLIDDESAVTLDGGALGLVAGAGGPAGASAMIPPLPPELKLSDAQRAQITQLVLAFQDATKADMQLLMAIQKKAQEARKAGKSPEEVHAILMTGAEIRARIEAAAKKLRTDIEAVLTPAQLAWVKAHAPKACRGAGTVLSPAQQLQIRTLMQAFEQSNHADLVAVAEAMAKARQAKLAGKTEAEIRAILETVSAAMARLETAHRTLKAQIEAVLTPEQKASGCFVPRP